MIKRVTFNDPFVKRFKRLAPGRAAGGRIYNGD